MNIRNYRLITAVVSLTLAGAVHAQRTVIINGALLSAQEIVRLESISCTAVPNGNYWVDLTSGAWGYAGNSTRMGVVGDACNQTKRRKSLSERGLLYRPGEIMSGR